MCVTFASVDRCGVDGETRRRPIGDAAVFLLTPRGGLPVAASVCFAVVLFSVVLFSVVLFSVVFV